jgi:hypothetical protein
VAEPAPALAAPRPAPAHVEHISDLSTTPVHVITRTGKVLFIPGGCAAVDGGYDLDVHFHGVPDVVGRDFTEAGVHGALVVINLGIGSGPYEDAFQFDGRLGLLLDRIDGLIGEQCPRAHHHIRRVALSAWSAGYGALYHILSHRHDAAFVDAALFADGMHVGLIKHWPRRLNTLAMIPYDHFAREAVAGKKLMAITHTSIQPSEYASTTETANHLTAILHLDLKMTHQAGPVHGMIETSHAAENGFHVVGFAGNDKQAHCNQLYAMGTTLFPLLAARWARL